VPLLLFVFVPVRTLFRLPVKFIKKKTSSTLTLKTYCLLFNKFDNKIQSYIQFSIIVIRGIRSYRSHVSELWVQRKHILCLPHNLNLTTTSLWKGKVWTSVFKNCLLLTFKCPSSISSVYIFIHWHTSINIWKENRREAILSVTHSYLTIVTQSHTFLFQYCAVMIIILYLHSHT
jgi:hypothetical protein